MSAQTKFEIPEFLNEKLFCEALTSGLHTEDIKIISFSITKGSKSGDNYLSNIYRVPIVYTVSGSDSPREINLIVKYVTDPEPQNLGGNNVFVKEKYVYMNVLPRIEEVLRGVRLAPHCYHTINDPKPTFFLEDLKASGYEMADRRIGLDENHCKIVLEKLGCYHAGTMLLLQKDPSVRNVDLLQRGLFATPDVSSGRLQKYIRRNVDIIVDNIAQLPGYENVAEKLRKWDIDEFLNEYTKSTPAKEDDLLVLLHGDMWVNNFMFKYDGEEKSPIDVIFVDFQGSAFASLGLDINYFLATSLKTDLLTTNTEKLIEAYYYPALKATLQERGYQKSPSLDKVLAEVRKKKIFKLFCSLVILPVISVGMEDAKEMSLENIRNDAVKSSAFATKRFIYTMKNTIKEFDKEGLLDGSS